MKQTKWYKDGVFYQIWPRSFRDGNGDGMAICGVSAKSWTISALLAVTASGFLPSIPPPVRTAAMTLPTIWISLRNLGAWRHFGLCWKVPTSGT